MHKEQEDGEIVTHVTETEARSGSRTRMTRNILAVSLLLAIAVLAIAMGFGFFETQQTGADQINGNMTQPNAS